MSFLSGLFSTIIAGGQSFLAKAGLWLMIALAVAAAGAGIYFYVHRKNEALAAAQSALAAAQKQVAELQSVNTQDEQVIGALQDQQQQSAAAASAMNGRDQTIEATTAAITATIASDSASCAAAHPPIIKLPGSSTTSTGKDAPVAGVLADALSALAKAQTAGSKS